MERNVEIDKISDGKRYGANDLVKVGCDDCRGCSACCHGMGDSIVLDPMDVYRLEKKLGKTMEEILLAGNVALRVVDGVILPHLKMTEQSDQCSFLNEEGRCSIHDARPGFCRMFPLGRLYDDGTFSSSLNICAGMSEIKGTYIVEDTKVILDFPTKTGIQFIDEGQPFIFNITDDELTLDASNDFFSCSYVNVFKLKQGE